MSALNLFMPNDARISNAFLVGEIERNARKVSIFVTDIVEEPGDEKLIGSVRFVHRTCRPNPRHANGDVSANDGGWFDLVLNQNGSVSCYSLDGEADEFDCVNFIHYEKGDLSASAFLVAPGTNEEFSSLARLLQNRHGVGSSKSPKKVDNENHVTSLRKSASTVKSLITSASSFCEVMEEKVSHVMLCSKYFFGYASTSTLITSNVIFLLLLDFFLGSLAARFFTSQSITSDIMHYFQVVGDVRTFINSKNI